MAFKTLSEYKGLGPKMPVTVEYFNHTTHKYVVMGEVFISDPEEIFTAMQGENWSPNGEGNDLIVARGADHTSMSVGDRIIYPDGSIKQVDSFGWLEY